MVVPSASHRRKSESGLSIANEVRQRRYQCVRHPYGAAYGFIITAWCVFATSADSSADVVTFRISPEDATTRQVDGQVLVEAVDGGLMLRGDDGRIWIVQPEELVMRTPAADPPPISADEMASRMLAELPDGFQAYQTAHYVLLHQGNEAYTRDCGVLFESLYRAFFAFWKNNDVRLSEPDYPLVALVFAGHESFLRHGRDEIGSTAESVIGYYHLPSNRMTTFRVPNIERNIATIIHEATHQLAYNCGLQTRFADNPMWVSEGMATFFESPDFSNPRGWRGVGRVNTVNLHRWRQFAATRPADSLVTLVADDSRFRSGATAEAAYGEAWALTYFLIKTRRKEYVEYLEQLRVGKPLDERTPRERIEMIETTFGQSIAELSDDLVTYMRRVR